MSLKLRQFGSGSSSRSLNRSGKPPALTLTIPEPSSLAPEPAENWRGPLQDRRDGTAETSKSRGFVKNARTVVERWSQRSSRSVRFAVVRHGERADVSFDPVDGEGDWPFDPALSAEGRLQAKAFGRTLRRLGGFGTVVASPFLRCVETALEICAVLRCPLLVDQSWGEIMSRDVYGSERPEKLFRPLAHAVAAAKRRGVKVLNEDRLLGKEPVFPERLEQSRARFGEMFCTYLDRARVTRRGFIAVTHAHALAPCLSLMSDAPGDVNGVPFCGHIVGELALGSLEPPVLIQHKLEFDGKIKEGKKARWFTSLNVKWRNTADVQHSLRSPAVGGSPTDAARMWSSAPSACMQGTGSPSSPPQGVRSFSEDGCPELEPRRFSLDHISECESDPGLEDSEVSYDFESKGSKELADSESRKSSKELEDFERLCSEDAEDTIGAAQEPLSPMLGDRPHDFGDADVVGAYLKVEVEQKVVGSKVGRTQPTSILARCDEETTTGSSEVTPPSNYSSERRPSNGSSDGSIPSVGSILPSPLDSEGGYDWSKCMLSQDTVMFGQSEDGFGRSSDPFGQSADPFGQSSDPLASFDPKEVLQHFNTAQLSKFSTLG